MAFQVLDAQGRVKVYNTPTEVTFTTTGNIDNLDFSGADLIRMNNATLATIRGLAAGYPGQRVTIVSIGAGMVSLAHQNTNSSAANRLLNVVTSAETNLAATFGKATYQYDDTTDRWRLISHEQGAFIDMAYNSGNFTAQAGTWTVDSGDLITMAYFLRGTEVTFKFKVLSSSTSSAPNYVDALLPYTCAKSEYANLCWGADPGGTHDTGNYVVLSPEFDTSHATVIRFYKYNNAAWGTNTNSQHISMHATYTTS